MGIAEVISALQLALAVFTQGRTALRERKDGDLLNPTALTNTYEILQYLREDVRGLRIALSEEDRVEDRQTRLWQFWGTLREFIRLVELLNLSALIIYDREMASGLAAAIDADTRFGSSYSALQRQLPYYETKQVPKPPKKDLKKLYELNDRFRVLDGEIYVAEQKTDPVLNPYAEQPWADLASQLGTLEDLLEKLSEQLATFVRINWEPKDLS